jgi:hypothetical protein
VTHTGCLLATSDEEVRKIGPSPSGCGENRAILHSRPRRWARHSLRARLRLARFSLATPPARKLITGSRADGRSLSWCRATDEDRVSGASKKADDRGLIIWLEANTGLRYCGLRGNPLSTSGHFQQSERVFVYCNAIRAAVLAFDISKSWERDLNSVMRWLSGR